MMHKRTNLVIGMTTFNNEMLRLSVRELGKIRQKFTLIIYNDNPATTLDRRQIRNMGYYGALQIINSEENVGELRAKVAVVNAAQELKPDWIMFCDDDDLLIDADIPCVSENNFAIIQNAIILRSRVVDLIRATTDVSTLIPDGENVVLAKPHLGLIGTPVRASVLFGVCDIISEIYDAIRLINEKLGFLPPVDAMMWNFVNTYARHINPDSVPIYMDRINYIKNDLDSARMKYELLARPVRNADEQIRRVLEKYNLILEDALAAAALRGL